MKYFFLCLTLFSQISFSKSLDGIDFPDKISVEGKELVLNGVGIRKATFLKIKVYYGALYLEEKTADPNKFLESSSKKHIVMHFVRSVDREKLESTFKEVFTKINKNSAELMPDFNKFTSHLSDMEKGDVMTINFLSDGVQVFVKNKKSDKIGNFNFSKALLNIWFINPQDENLKDGLLGK